MGLFFKSKAETAHAQTLRNQAEAADPASSAWVSANAGTGKTHVLTMRVLRLLLAGTPPERILALTYTKAAAAEMSKRVFGRLAEWVTASDGDLKGRLKELLGRAPSADEVQRGRQLFAVAIETPGGLKVQTIHAFCERLLQRFPLEAGVPPGFAILDDQERQTLLREALDETLAEAAADKAGPLWSALQKAVAYAVEDGFERILPEVFARRGRAEEPLSELELARIERQLRTALGVRAGATAETLTAELAEVFAEELLPMLAAALRAGTASDAEQADSLQLAINAGSVSRRAEALEGFFLTRDKKPRSRLATKSVGTARPDVPPLLQTAQSQFVAFHTEQKGLAVVEATIALLRLATDVLARYTAAKERSAALDFDDLVGKAASLLAASAAVEWVLYKLDGGLDHVLVDEAQDTSPLQWQVIRSLADEFFSGAGAREQVRTLFAVGDEKQSIYGFQGAAPAMFAAMGQGFADRAERAGFAWRRVPLTVSFRAVEPLLDAVDRIFEAPSRTPGLSTSDKPIEHTAHRAGQAGLIEIWETEKRDPASPAEPWSPLAEAGISSPVARLASRIADTIHGWLKSGELLPSEDRPVRAGDILILVRKRNPFAPAMISALKARGIKVAGADRLLLIDQIAVQDLTALGDFLTLPDDDLALAAVLKSPLFGLDDGDLLRLAPERKGSLWDALRRSAPDDARLQPAAAMLARWLESAARLPPFEFYSGLLVGEGLRARMLKRLGAEAADAIDELLNLALAYDDGAPPSLQGFLSWLRAGQHEIKRDMEQGRDEVRVMTVHGAKGLEAPIVFLPDTCSTRSGRWPGGLLKLDGDEAAFLWPVKGTSNLAAVQSARAREDAADAEERNRLLYVALTRARDRLYVAGFEGAHPPPPDCWYNLIRAGLNGQLQEIVSADARRVWRLESKQTAEPEKPKTRAIAPVAVAALPSWVTQPAPQEPMLTVPLAPSRLAPLETDTGGEAETSQRRYAEPPILPPAALAEDSRFLRGNITHALLEHLPSLPPDSWASSAQVFVESRARSLAGEARKGIVAETLAVLRNPDFAALFGAHSRAEVPIVAEIARPHGRGPALRLTGKVDRLVVEGDFVLIVDYKTNRPPPSDPANVADAYLLQLAAYRLALGQIFPDRRVRAAILWTDGPRIMEIPEARLRAYEQRLWQLDPASLDA